jgi:hypothetical protein
MLKHTPRASLMNAIAYFLIRNKVMNDEKNDTLKDLLFGLSCS